MTNRDDQIYKAIEEMIEATKQRGERTMGDKARFPYALGFLQSTVYRWIQQLPREHQDAILADMQLVTEECNGVGVVQ